MNVNSRVESCAQTQKQFAAKQTAKMLCYKKIFFGIFVIEQLNNYSPLPDDFGLRSGLEPLCNIRLIFNSLDQVCEPRVFLENLNDKETDFCILLNVYTSPLTSGWSTLSLSATEKRARERTQLPVLGERLYLFWIEIETETVTEIETETETEG